MVAKRGKDGNVTDEPTAGSGRGTSPGKDPTVSVRNVESVPVPGNQPGDDPTVILGGHRSASSAGDTVPPPRTSSDEDTVIYRSSRKAGSPEDNATDGAPELPVGWLVVIAGPGKGHVRKLIHGVNSLGRSADERVPLDFGDMAISSEKHALIAYEPKARKFHITHHSGANLTYVNDDLVMGQALLEPYSLIQIGETKMRFVPLCGDHFSWDELD